MPADSNFTADVTNGFKFREQGLAIAKAIIEAHQGEIGVTSQPGQGSVFYFTLPVA